MHRIELRDFNEKIDQKFLFISGIKIVRDVLVFVQIVVNVGYF